MLDEYVLYDTGAVNTISCARCDFLGLVVQVARLATQRKLWTPAYRDRGGVIPLRLLIDARLLFDRTYRYCTPRRTSLALSRPLALSRHAPSDDDWHGTKRT